MHTTKKFQNYDASQSPGGLGIRLAGNIVTFGVVTFLVAGWLLTSPFIQLSDWLAAREKKK